MKTAPSAPGTPTLSGMTGFASAEGGLEGVRWRIDARSVNGRALDVKTRTPSGFDALDAAIRDQCAQRFVRGSIQVSVTLRREAAAAAASPLNMPFLEAMMEAARPYVQQGLAAPPSFDGLLRLKDAFTAQDSDDLGPNPELLEALTGASASALEALRAARLAEGEMLRGVLLGHVATLADLAAAATQDAAAAPEAIRLRLLARVAALGAAVDVEPQRLAQEAALLASKADVREELDRLDAHLASARALLEGPGPLGRKLDFLAQELVRETNTLCSKSAAMSLTQIGLEMKAVVDQVKEQAANVE